MMISLSPPSSSRLLSRRTVVIGGGGDSGRPYGSVGPVGHSSDSVRDSEARPTAVPGFKGSPTNIVIEIQK